MQRRRFLGLTIAAAMLVTTLRAAPLEKLLPPKPAATMTIADLQRLWENSSPGGREPTMTLVSPEMFERYQSFLEDVSTVPDDETQMFNGAPIVADHRLEGNSVTMEMNERGDIPYTNWYWHDGSQPYQSIGFQPEGFELVRD
jgi:hypothetical protein